MKLPRQNPMHPAVRIVIPCYDQGAFLRETLESVLAQTFADWELVVVDDGSTDDTIEVARSFARPNSDGRIRIIGQRNGGVADARNAGIRDTATEWVLPLDADDILAPSFLEEAIVVVRQRWNVDIVYSNVETFGDVPGQWIPNSFSRKKILWENQIPYAALFRKRLWEQVGGYDRSLPNMPDWNFWIAASKRALVVHRIPDKLLRYRVRRSGNLFSISRRIYGELSAMIRTLHPDLYDPKQLIADHERIAAMPDEALRRIEMTMGRFPELAAPFFWRGLRRERERRTADALSDYREALHRSRTLDWQPGWRCAFLQAGFGDIGGARLSLKEALRVRPDLPAAAPTAVFGLLSRAPGSIA